MRGVNDDAMPVYGAVHSELDSGLAVVDSTHTMSLSLATASDSSYPAAGACKVSAGVEAFVCRSTRTPEASVPAQITCVPIIYGCQFHAVTETRRAIGGSRYCSISGGDSPS